MLDRFIDALDLVEGGNVRAALYAEVVVVSHVVGVDYDSFLDVGALLFGV